MNVHTKSSKLQVNDVQCLLSVRTALKQKNAALRIKGFAHVKIGHLSSSWSASIKMEAQDNYSFLVQKLGLADNLLADSPRKDLGEKPHYILIIDLCDLR